MRPLRSPRLNTCCPALPCPAPHPIPPPGTRPSSAPTHQNHPHDGGHDQHHKDAVDDAEPVHLQANGGRAGSRGEAPWSAGAHGGVTGMVHSNASQGGEGTARDSPTHMCMDAGCHVPAVPPWLPHVPTHNPCSCTLIGYAPPTPPCRPGLPRTSSPPCPQACAGMRPSGTPTWCRSPASRRRMCTQCRRPPQSPARVAATGCPEDEGAGRQHAHEYGGRSRYAAHVLGWSA